MDTPNVPVAPAAPSAPVVTSTPTEAKAPIDAKTGAPVDAAAANKIKVDSKAEAAVIQKIKVGDTEYDETTLKSMIEKSKGANKKFLEAAQVRKEAMRFFKLAKENPREFLEKTGVDPRKFSYDEVAKDIQDKLRDPKEVELEKAQRRLKEYEEKEAVEQEKVKAERLEQQSKAIEQRLHAEAIRALEAHPSIPKNGFSVAKMAKYIDVVQQRTGTLLSFEDVAGVIEKDIHSEVAGLLKGATAEQIIGLIGQEGAEAIRKYHLDQLKNPLKEGSGAVNKNGDGKPAEKRWKNSHEYWKSIDRAAKAERGE